MDTILKRCKTANHFIAMKMFFLIVIEQKPEVGQNASLFGQIHMSNALDSFSFIVSRGMKKRNSFHNNDSSISCRGRLWASKWACKSYKNTLAETILWREVLLMTAGFIKGERENWMGLLSYCYAFSLSLIPLQRVSLHKPWITDLSGITSMSLHCLPSSQRQRGAIIRLSLQWDVKQC